MRPVSSEIKLGVAIWRTCGTVPDLIEPASIPGAWDAALALQEQVRAKGYLSMCFMGTGIFEQMRFLEQQAGTSFPASPQA